VALPTSAGRRARFERHHFHAPRVARTVRTASWVRIRDGVVVAAAAQLSFRYNTTRRCNPDKETAARKRTILESRLERQQGRMIGACAHGLTLATRRAVVRSSVRRPYTVVAFFDDTETAHPVVQRRRQIDWRLARAEGQRSHGRRPPRRRQRRRRRPCSTARNFAGPAVKAVSILFRPVKWPDTNK
jgi:hypothetical protein